MHLRIEQNNGVIEEVSNSVITKLYGLAVAGLDASSYLKGRLHAPIGYRTQIQYLTAAYPDLYIDVTNYAIPFEDPNMVTYLNNIGVGSDGMVTETQASAATVAANSTNTTITKFNELKYFTNITSSKGGWTQYTSGAVQFKDWTALEEVDISNFTSIGHLEGWAYEDTFAGCTSLKTVTASSNLTQIGYSAFNGCSNLEYISGLSGQIEVSGNAFNGCEKLENRTFSNAAIYLVGDKSSQFFNCKNITSIALSSNTTTIPTQAFEGSGLTTITGGSVTTIQQRAFYDCSDLSTIFSLSSVTQIGNAAFCNSNIGGDLSLPVLTFLDQYAFYRSKIQRVLDLGVITEIPVHCFAYCTSLTSVVAPTTVTALSGDGHAFEGCTNLQSARGLSNIIRLSGYDFNDCTQLGTTDIDYSKLTAIKQQSFYNCQNLTDTINAANVTTVESSAFRYCKKITSVSLPNVTTFGETALADTGITSFTISNKVTNIGSGTFCRCTNLAAVTIENNPSFTDLGNNTFKECLVLTSINIPEGITTLQNEAFRYTALTRLDFPSTLTTITGSENFNNTNITTFIFRSTTPPTVPSDGIFVGVPSGFTIYVPDASVSAYQSAPGWSQYASSITGLSNL